MGTPLAGGSTHARLLAIASTMIVAGAATALADNDRGTFSFVLENDVFYNLDRDYTNGVQFAWTSGPVKADACWECDVARVLPFFDGSGQMRVNYALGQSMFTPSDITLVNPPLTDRPYAGWLYGSLGVISKVDPINSSWSHLEQLQLSLGVVGPSSEAEQVQTFVHQLIGSNKPMGWDTQLKDEPTLLLTYERSWRYRVDDLPFGLEMFATPHLGAAVGNVFDYVNAGATLTLGWNLGDDYGPPRIQPSTPGSGYFEQKDGVGLYAFAGVDARAVARNIFLDGNTWADSRSVDKNTFVGDGQVGVALTFRSARLSFTHVFRTKEFTTQNNADQFGAVGLSLQF